ncbi:MAG: phosphoribosylamine--glycine ligase [Campylobacterales bacterium]|nr:phosphoribosylamine--glycine ligase [Campylobacterales bacterium]
MNVLIVGNGGREYSIGLALKNDKFVKNIFFAPGNGATTKLGTNLDIKDYEKLADFCIENSINLTIVGPEQPLVDGIVDIFKQKNLTIYGPSKNAARLEGSKAFMKNFLKQFNIPTAKYIETSNYSEAENFIDSLDLPIVVKADGLCAGKGVIIAKTKDEAKQSAKEMLNGDMFGKSGERVVVEEFLDGYELSVFAICDGENYKILPAAQDHKRLLDNDEGPNTGGMGAYAPTPLINEELYKKIEDRVVKPTLKGMKEIESEFCGTLFIGLMIVKGEPIVLEYNVRFGDPECEVLMALLESSAYELFLKASTKQLDTLDIKFKDKFGLAVVVASKNYPYKNSPKAKITIDDKISTISDTHISFAGVEAEDGELYATGGRVLLVVSVSDDIKSAREKSYEALKFINFDGAQYRKDIAYQALKFHE